MARRANPQREAPREDDSHEAPDGDLNNADNGSADENQPEAKKPLREILYEEVREGEAALFRPTNGLLLSGLSAGMDIGFSALLMATAITLLPDTASAYGRFFTASLYALGFVFVVVGRSELFTEHTTLAVLPVLQGRAPLRMLARLWVLLYVANLVGTTIFAFLGTKTALMTELADKDAFAEMARRLLDHPPLAILLSAMLAGWLMGLLSWLVAAARDTIGQIVIVWIIATAIGFMGLHHCIVGTAEIASARFAGVPVGIGEYARFLFFATLGNAIGGTVFVALVKFGHARLEATTEDHG